MKDGECVGGNTFVCQRRPGPVLSEAFTKCVYVRSVICRGQVEIALPIYNDGL